MRAVWMSRRRISPEKIKYSSQKSVIRIKIKIPAPEFWLLASGRRRFVILVKDQDKRPMIPRFIGRDKTESENDQPVAD